MQEIVGYQDGEFAVAGDEIVGEDGNSYDANRLPITAFGVQSSAAVAAGGSATIAVNPTRAIRPDRLVMDATTAAGFSVSSIRIGPHVVFSGDTAIPGACFVANAVGIRMKSPVTASSSRPFVITVVNNTAGPLTFYAGVFGPSVG